MYDDLVKRLCCCADNDDCSRCHFEMKCPGYDMIFAEAADAIEKLRAKADLHKEVIEDYRRANMMLINKFPKWIPVTERLPKAGRKSYWVCTDTGYQCECRWTNDRFGIIESDEWGWKIFDIPQYQKVVAWMPLPDPYEPPKEE